MRILSSDKIESILRRKGFLSVCGLDEAGRGALAGPLVVAAVILPPVKMPHLRDSKLTTPKERIGLSKQIKKKAVSWAIGISEVDSINSLGIQTSTYLAFRNALNSLKKTPDYILVDFYKIPDVSIPQLPIVFGDRISQSIAAASIIAKTTRDEIMTKLGRLTEYNKFCFDQNFGYGTRQHRAAIREVGPSKCHRIGYRSVKDFKTAAQIRPRVG